MLKIGRWANGEVIFTVSGRMKAKHAAMLKALFNDEADNKHIVLDLRDLTLVDRDGVRFLERCEAEGIKLRHIPTYIREWIERERETLRSGAV